MVEIKWAAQPKAHDFCPHCGSVENRVYHTERISDCLTVRYHECRCGERFKTADEFRSSTN